MQSDNLILFQSIYCQNQTEHFIQTHLIRNWRRVEKEVYGIVVVNKKTFLDASVIVVAKV